MSSEPGLRNTIVVAALGSGAAAGSFFPLSFSVDLPFFCDLFETTTGVLVIHAASEEDSFASCLVVVLVSGVFASVDAAAGVADGVDCGCRWGGGDLGICMLSHAGGALSCNESVDDADVMSLPAIPRNPTEVFRPALGPHL